MRPIHASASDAMGDLVERDPRQRRDDVGDEHLLREADDEDARADGGAAERRPAHVELAGDGLVADDRARDELGKERDVERDVDRIAVGAEAAAVDVDDVGQAMEGEERDAERQFDIGPAEVTPSGLQAAARFPVMKLAYLKMPSTRRLPATATPSAHLRPDPARLSMTIAAA